MIQRPQSLYLLLAALASASVFVWPFATGPATLHTFFSDGKFSVADNSVLLALSVLAALAAFVVIFLYRNRSTQLRWSRIGALLALVTPLYALGFWVVLQQNTTDAPLQLQPGGLVALLSPAAWLMAARGIQRDIKTVRSSSLR